MKNDDGWIWTLIVLLVLGAVGVILWRRGAFSRIGAWVAAPPAYGPTPPQGLANPPGPTEPAAAAPGGGSAYGRVCNAIYSGVGKGLSGAPDPRAQAAGVVTQAMGPLSCAAHEYLAGKAWDGTKWLASNTAAGVQKVGEEIADVGKSIWNHTLGKLF